MKTVQADGFEVWFEGALDTFTFDEKDTEEPIFHVDIHEGRRYRGRTQRDRHLQQTEEPSWSVVLQGASFKRLESHLKHKFRDPFFTGTLNRRWTRQRVKVLARGCNVVNLGRCKNFPKWPVKLLNATTEASGA